MISHHAHDDDRAAIARLMDMGDYDLQAWVVAHSHPCQRCGRPIARPARAWFHITADGAFRFCWAVERAANAETRARRMPRHWQATPPQDIAWGQAVADARGVQA